MTHSNQSLEQEVIDTLKININLVFQKINELKAESDERKRQLTELDKRIICRSLLGDTRAKIVEDEGKHNEDSIVDALTNLIYPKLSRLLQVEKPKIAGNWARIINLLLSNGFELSPPPTPNVNTLMSFGYHILITRNNPNVSKFMQAGAQAYSRGAYFSAFDNFLIAWSRDKGNPELLIYINNCLIAEYKAIYERNQIETYSIAVVVPVSHNSGIIATELLYGIAQMQLQVNLNTWDNLPVPDKNLKNCCRRLKQELEINSNDYSEGVRNIRILLQILIVNENNDIIYPGVPFNQAATNLAQVSEQLEIIAVVGHYSSEMTLQALRVYNERELLLVCPSSTSDELSNAIGMNSFLRMTTQDRIATQRLGNYLLSIYNEKQARVTIIYNQNSSYCKSFKSGLYRFLKENSEQFYLLPECGELSDDYSRLVPHLKSIQSQGVNTIIIIQDGGIEPNTINNAGIITRLLMNNCLIVGSATFYQDNVLLWAEENIQQGLLDNNKASNLVACVPWHRSSQNNGCDSNNKVAADFCKLGAILWGQGKLSWRSATAYDAVLILVKALRQYAPQDHKALCRTINQHFRQDGGSESGVTGKIEFDPNGDRLNPPTEMVKVSWNEQTERCEWVAG